MVLCLRRDAVDVARTIEAPVRPLRYKTAGNVRVTYRNAQGRTMDAVILGEGSRDGFRIQLTSGRRLILDNVQLMERSNDVNVISYRL